MKILRKLHNIREFADLVDMPHGLKVSVAKKIIYPRESLMMYATRSDVIVVVSETWNEYSS